MKFFSIRFLLLLALVPGLLGFSFQFGEEPDARAIVTKMIESIDAHRGAKYTVRTNERLPNQKNLFQTNVLTKVHVSPRKIYLKMITEPNLGTEILYVEGIRENKALVNPGKFLPTLKLSPFNSLLTKNQHHTLLSSGFSIVSEIVKKGVERADMAGKFDSIFLYFGEVTWSGRACYKIVINDPTWTLTTYRAAKGERMYDVALKFLIPEYSLVELNGVRDFEEDLSGRTLKIPTTYARKTVFYVDKENYFPIFQEMSDSKGVFERYEITNLVVNPIFKKDEFTEKFPEYKF